VVKGRSPFAGRLGTAVAAPLLPLVDDPLDPAGESACAFAGEGTPSRRNVLVEAGILRGFLADARWGRRLGTGSTGSCRRPGPKAPPAAGISNLLVVPGADPLPALCRRLGRGLLVTEFLGMHTADPVSGDFAAGAAGLLFDGSGECEPVRGFAVSGNLPALLRRVVAVGSDFRWCGSFGAPSLAVEELDVGGE